MATEENNTPNPGEVQDLGNGAERVVAEPPVVETPAQERPEGLPEGFDSWEAFGKAKLAEGKAPSEGDAPGAAASDAGQADTDELPEDLKAEIEKLPEANREKATPFFKEFSETGTLTDESKAAAAEAFGVTVEMVDLYMEGAAAKQASASEPFYEAAGGKAVYDEFAAWASQGGMTAAEMAEFNAELDKGDDAAKEMIAKGIALWKAEGNGPAPRDITRDQPGKDSTQGSSDVFTSREQQTQAIRDPRYAKDAAYRAQVDAKIGRSNV